MWSKNKKPATKVEDIWMEHIKLFGCVVCWVYLRRQYTPCEAHHIVEKGKQAGHHKTIGLCPWHHRGEPDKFGTEANAYAIAGPSMAKHPEEYRERFGDDAWLLNCNRELISAWPDWKIAGHKLPDIRKTTVGNSPYPRSTG